MVCNGNGECMSMAALAKTGRTNGDPTPVTYGTNPNDPLTWDSDQMRGCFCSEGWEGFDCSLKSCPKGDDPQTLKQANEVQHISCTDFGDSGSFALTFRGETTRILEGIESAVDLEAALNALPSTGRVSVTYADPSIYSGAPDLLADSLHLCRSSNQIIAVEFLSPTGDVPPITAKKLENFGIDDSIEVSEFIKGTKEYIVCSGRGLCNHDTGLCECFTGFASSDGQGNAGTLRDCGFKSPYALEKYESF